MIRDKNLIQFIRYLVVGGFNTLAGYSIYALFNYLLTDKVPFSYLFASALSNVVAITISFLTYKCFVFKTKGNFIREYLRCYAVYGFSFLLGLVLLSILVEGIGINSYLAGALLIPVGVIISFLGHRNYSFRQVALPENGA